MKNENENKNSYNIWVHCKNQFKFRDVINIDNQTLIPVSLIECELSKKHWEYAEFTGTIMRKRRSTDGGAID